MWAECLRLCSPASAPFYFTKGFFIFNKCYVPMFGAAPGRETIFIFCICWIICGSLNLLLRDGEGVLKPRQEQGPLFFLKSFSPGVCGVL